MKRHWNRLVGALVVLGIGLATFAPAGTHPGVSLPGAAGRTATGQKTGQLSVAGASAGLSRVSQAADEKPVDDGPVSVDYMVPTAVTVSEVQAGPAATAGLPWLWVAVSAGMALGLGRVRRRA